MLEASTIDFIRQLAKNNNKEWFDNNRAKYNQARGDFEQLVSEIIEKISHFDPPLADLQAKHCIFRINRDVRFSADKSPYKTNFGASFEKGGRKSGLAGYYLHLEPGNKSMAGGGIWMPDAETLKKVRQEIDYNWDEFRTLLNDNNFKKIYGDLDHSEQKLRREPKGYEAGNPAIEYLKLKSFIAIHPLTDEELTKPEITNKIAGAFETLAPLIHFINRAIS